MSWSPRYQVSWKLARRFWRRRFLKGFYHIWAWRPSWSCDPDAANKISFPLPKEAPHKIWLWSAQRFRRRRCLKLFTTTDGRTTDGHRLDGYTISSPCEPNGSGELKIWVEKQYIHCKARGKLEIDKMQFWQFVLRLKFYDDQLLKHHFSLGFRVSDQVRFKPACSAAEISWSLTISDKLKQEFSGNLMELDIRVLVGPTSCVNS